MVIEPQKSYTKSPSKLRILWNTAMRLIGEYENFDRRVTLLEKNFSELSYKISIMVDRIKNV